MDLYLVYRFQDKQRFLSKKSQIFSPRVFSAPAEGVLLVLGTCARSQKTRMMGLSG